MASQWENLLQNLGEWQGSFTRFSPQGEELSDTPTVVSLEGVNNNQAMHMVVRRLPPGQPPQEQVFDFSSLSKGALFFPNGAFSQGSLQWSPFSQFGAELGLIHKSRRMRMIQMFNQESKLEYLTLIREKLAGTDTPEREPLTVKQLLGEWQGEAMTIDHNFRSPETFSTRLHIRQEGENRLHQELKFGSRTITSTAKINGSTLLFEESDLPIQILLLPDAASANCPLEIKRGYPFVLEAGWLIAPNLRHRIVRSYSDRGELLNLTLVQEEKVSS
ncbi:MAG: DUF3598 family protein [Oscillatoria sp. PMC 1068.18]|nr:DUF3598 family protein [Oscillatoria sp. PMC 1076.18]MEC4988964.1 DUF3598 family protein [Oscillatoria sp. PMC 1068.18]